MRIFYILSHFPFLYPLVFFELSYDRDRDIVHYYYLNKCQRKTFIVAKNIFYWARTEDKHTHTHTSRSACFFGNQKWRQFSSKKKGARAFVPSRQWELISCSCLYFSLAVNWWLYREWVEMETETEEALQHPSTTGKSTLKRLGRAFHSAPWLFALGVWKIKWQTCFLFEDGIQSVVWFYILQQQTWIGVAPCPCTLLLEPRQLNWTFFLCVIVTKKTVTVTNARLTNWYNCVHKNHQIYFTPTV